MTSDTSIANLALTTLGEKVIVNMVTDTSQRAIIVNLHYEAVRDAVLAAFPWNFAMKRGALAQETATPAFGYTYQYALPADCLRVWRLNGANSNYTSWKVEGNKLMTDESTASIRYIAKITDPNQFSPIFIQAFKELLAAEIGYALTSNKTTVEERRKAYEAKLLIAYETDSQEGEPESADDFGDAVIISARE